LRRTVWFLMLLALITLLTVSACVVEPRARVGVSAEVVVREPPPPPREEVIVAAPSPRHVWIPGHWQWEGHWVWLPGHWEKPPRRTATWVPGHWAARGDAWAWIPGHWK
jgi:WXXGXW repeat (2 copies)